MPYISSPGRKDIEKHGEIYFRGTLNYLITKLLINYIKHKGLSYNSINDCLGALEGAKLEFYRRVAVPYEKKKIKENGDVYPKELL